MSDRPPEITPDLLKTIDVLEAIESLIDLAPPAAVDQILRETWLKVSETFPEDFKEATKEDAGAEGLRRYIRVKAFFQDPIAHPITPEELEAYYQNHAPIDADSAEFYFP
ncbi:MAG TPA: hypothetical protein V6C57_18390 [Coleofasciculaceae cyanobacterium]